MIIDTSAALAVLHSAGVHQLILLISRADIRIDHVDREQAEIALDAYRRFGN